MTLLCSPAMSINPESRSSEDGATATWFNGELGSTFVNTLPVRESQAFNTLESDERTSCDAVSFEDECHFRSTIGNKF